MPCNEPSWAVEERYNQYYKDLKKTEAMLCAVLTVVENSNKLNLLWNINVKESGVSSKEIFYWWDKHKAADKKRRFLEQEKEEKDRKKMRALEKLTEEEKRILGLC